MALLATLVGISGAHPHELKIVKSKRESKRILSERSLASFQLVESNDFRQS